MSHQDTSKEIENILGSVPEFMKNVQKDTLVQMWPLMKKYTLGQSAIPQKYREMISLAAAATMKCPYCELFHREVAKMYGATEEELAEVGTLAGQTAFWSANLHAQHYDMETFAKELRSMGQKMSAK